jgi:hypothetical protein
MFKNDATDVGVSDDINKNKDEEDFVDEFAEEEQQERPKSPRELMMEQIYEKRVEDLKADGVKLGDEEDEDDDATDAQDKIKVKVDGKETELTREEFEKQVREYQKHKAADKRLEEAAKKMKELEQLEATLKAQAEAKSKEKEEKKDDINISTLDGYQNLFEKFATDIRDGDDEDAVEAVKEFAKALSGMVPKSQSSKSVDEQVREALDKVKQEEARKLEEEQAQAQAKEVEEAKTTFNERFKEELKNGDFFELAVMEDGKLLRTKEWEGKPLKERFLQAGENAKKWLRGKGSQQTAKDDKRNLRPVSQKSSTARLRDRDEGESPMTPSEVIADMKRRRGQFA